MAQGSPVFPEFPLRLSLVVEPAVACGGPQLCPIFSGVPAPCPRCPARVPLVSPEVPCPGALPQEEAWGGGQALPGSCASSRQPAGLSGHMGQVLCFLCSQTPRSVFRFPPLGHSHPAGLMGSASPTWGHRHLGPSSVASIAHHFLFCFLVGCLL